MTWLSRMMAIFPVLHVGLVASAWTCAGLVTGQPLLSIGLLVLGFAFLYLWPPLCYRWHQRRYPLKNGFSAVTDQAYSPWWGGHQMQLVFIAVPALEACLRLVPGLYSAWLRLWGASIGARVYWTPRVEIVDRPALKVGDDVVFGHHAILYAHLIAPKDRSLRLYVGTITIGNGVLIGAESKIGPGCKVDDGVQLPYGTVSRMRQHFKKDALLDHGGVSS